MEPEHVDDTKDSWDEDSNAADRPVLSEGLTERGDCAQLYAALAAAKPELPNIEARATGRATKTVEFKYADLGELRKKCDPVLGKHGLAVIFPFHGATGGQTTVSTMLIHRSGARLVANIKFSGATDMKMFGGQTTYLARYGYAKMLGLDTGDDLDKVSSEPEAPRSQAMRPKAEPPSARETLSRDIKALAKQCGIKNALELSEYSKEAYGLVPQEMDDAGLKELKEGLEEKLRIEAEGSE